MEIENKINLISKQINENINSHIFLIETNDTDKCLKDIKTIIKKVLKNAPIVSKQIDEEIYLEWIIVRPEGKEIKKDAIEILQERIKTKPILSQYMFYTILNSEKMNDVSSNKLLKTIEEPNDGILGFIVTENIDQILPTIKSRCETIKLLYEQDNINHEDLTAIHEITKKLIVAIETNNLLEYNLTKINSDFIKENGQKIANLIKEYYNKSINLVENSFLDSGTLEIILKNNNTRAIVKKAKYLNKTINKFTQSMNQDLLLEKIFIEIRK